MGIVKTRTTPYHPQSDGMIERFNRTLLSMLRMAAVDDKSNWDLKLPCLMLAYRTSVHETTKHTPFSLMFGRELSPHDVNEEMYDMVVVPQNQAAQLAPADEETQEPVEYNHEDPVDEVGEQDDGDDTEPQQVEQVPLRCSSHRRQPPERLGSWTYF
ncbi:hypothetical protein EMCRGX_G029887 [Ephydatia muelleri]